MIFLNYDEVRNLRNYLLGLPVKFETDDEEKRAVLFDTLFKSVFPTQWIRDMKKDGQGFSDIDIDANTRSSLEDVNYRKLLTFIKVQDFITFTTSLICYVKEKQHKEKTEDAIKLIQKSYLIYLTRLLGLHSDCHSEVGDYVILWITLRSNSYKFLAEINDLYKYNKVSSEVMNIDINIAPNTGITIIEFIDKIWELTFKVDKIFNTTRDIDIRYIYDSNEVRIILNNHVDRRILNWQKPKLSNIYINQYV